MSTVELLCADQVVRVDASICEMATERVHWRRFLAEPGAVSGVATPELERSAAALKRTTALGRALERDVEPRALGGAGATDSALERDVLPRALGGAGASDVPPRSLGRTSETAGALESDVPSRSLGGATNRALERDVPPRALGGAVATDRALVPPRSLGGLGATDGALESGLPPRSLEVRRTLERDVPIAKTPALVVRRHASLEGATEIDAPLGRCSFRFDGQTLDVVVEDGMYRGELVLRLAWYLLGTRLGAVLIHACAVKQGDVALVASGKSGDGKSTLARLCVGAGLEVLTDEVVMLFPDGRVSGTPFRSDFDNAGRPGLVQARYFVALEKAPHEAIEPLAPLAAVQLAMSQCFDVAEVALPRVEVRRRLLAFLGAVEVRTLAFRKDAAAGEFVRLALE